MKKNVIILSLLFTCLAFTAEAKVWRLNNQPGINADFTTTLQDAINGVLSGDTIYVEQSPFNYGDGIFAKKVTLIGAGYWLAENDSTSANKEKSMVDQLTFNTGSEGSVISGLYIYHIFGYGEIMFNVEINTNNITIQRNFIFSQSQEGWDAYVIKINGNRSGIVIQQNWIESLHFYGDNKCSILINGIPTNILIRNNFIKSYVGYTIKATAGSTNMGLMVKNNVIWGKVETYNEFYINNILVSGNFSNSTGGIVANNLCNETQFQVLNNNKQNIDMSTVFVDYDKYIDNGYILSANSPAKNAGFNGGDCGVFTSDYGGIPYVLSGMSKIPSIFDIQFNATLFPSNFETLEITVKAKSHN
jgi:hypothetical protein